MNYQEAWSFLDHLQLFKIKLGLDSMERFLTTLGNPQHDFPCIHVGGTNGKGSTGAILLSILTRAGYRVGLYTSPHLSSVRERFKIGAEYISKQDFAATASQIKTRLNGGNITYFEFTTALAMLWFAKKNIDLAILEVGMGGRLDATNVVTPLVSIITNVSMDHEQYLGATLGDVAAEKAGIIKPGVPVVSGAARDDSLRVIASTCEERRSPLYLLDRDFTGRRNNHGRSSWTYSGITQSGTQTHKVMNDLPLALKGDHQVDNAALALAALEIVQDPFPINETDLQAGLEQVRWPGRLEEFWRNKQGRIRSTPPISGENNWTHYLLDGAHNPDGAQTLKKSLQNTFSYQRLALIWAAMSDKDVSGALLEVAPLAESIIFTRPESKRAAPPEQLQKLLPNALKSRSTCVPTVEKALQAAADMTSDRDMICVAGSLYLVGRARELLRGQLTPDS